LRLELAGASAQEIVGDPYEVWIQVPTQHVAEQSAQVLAHFVHELVGAGLGRHRAMDEISLHRDRPGQAEGDDIALVLRGADRGQAVG
jgi:hypothetical protein